MTLEEGVLSAYGHADPYFFAIQPEKQSSSAASLHIQFQLEPKLPTSLTEALTGPQATEAIARLRAEMLPAPGTSPSPTTAPSSQVRLLERFEAMLDD